MEQISFYLDEHIHRAVADGLKHRGVNVLTVQEARKVWRKERGQAHLPYCKSSQLNFGTQGLESDSTLFTCS